MTDDLAWKLPETLAWVRGDERLVPLSPTGLKEYLAAIPDDKLESLGVVRKGAYDNWQQVVEWAAEERGEAQAENKHLREKLAAAEAALERWRKGEQIEGDYVGPEDDTEAPREVWVDYYPKGSGDRLGAAWLSSDTPGEYKAIRVHYIRADLAEQTTGKGSGDAAHRETAESAPSGAGCLNSPEPEPALGGSAHNDPAQPGDYTVGFPRPLKPGESVTVTLGGSALVAADEAERRVLLRVAEACERAWLIRLADELRGMVGR